MPNVKEAILAAAENVGNRLAKEAQKVPSGLISYLEWAADRTPACLPLPARARLLRTGRRPATRPSPLLRPQSLTNFNRRVQSW